ncbi:CD63 antigen-like [Leguminivora glycinivorella]|uniref:CD63 antigen-like n=1 Tax=Leguminivora glycinivorella TaxID=1035111 RepID=UPI002010096A|nr:CD63 antigen-like [Leguminivora glycinivorella]
MALGMGMSCVKYLLIAFNLLFAITGLIIFIVGIKAEMRLSPYIDFTDGHFWSSAPVVQIIVGVVIFIVAFLGCCGAFNENHCMIVTFAVLLLVTFIAELAVGIAGYANHANLEQSVVRHLNESLKEYPTNKDVQRSWDIMQTDLVCCGVFGPKDWSNNTLPVPDSCCSAREVTDGAAAACNMDSTDIHSNGCLPKMLDIFKDNAYLIGGVGLGIAFVPLLGVIFACCLARSIRSQYETV